jgi:hypothetical protein
MVLILLLAGRGFFEFEFDKKNSGGLGRDFLAVLLVFLRGGLENRVFFDGNLLVDLW